MLESTTGGKYDIGNFANGVYIVRVTTDNGISTKKVVLSNIKRPQALN